MNEAISKLTKDLKRAAITLSDDEARFLVDQYYMSQDNRKRAANQCRSLAESGEPNSLLRHLADQNESLEGQIKRALGTYAENHPVGKWMTSVYGIGPVLSAGLLAHIDINKAPTAGHIWAYAGLDPTKKWEKGQRRPWNAKLKTLCWLIGQSFMKFSKREECLYGKLYLEKKEYYRSKNEAGDYKEEATKRKDAVGKNTDAYKYYSQGKLPPAQIDARARRWVVKLFLSHLHEVWYIHAFGTKPPAPYPIAILGHAHKIEPQAK